MAKDYYKTLGVDKGASKEDIKKAYRKLAHQYHPDKSGGDETKFKEVNEAYQVLGDDQKRQQYDQFGSSFDGANFGGAQGNAGGFGFEDIFSQFGGFRNAGGNAGAEFDFGDVFSDLFGGEAHTRTARARDISISLDITLSEAFTGVQKTVTLRKNIVCGECGGKGYPADAELKTCTTCNGTGKVRHETRTPFGFFSQTGVCASCGGKGKIPSKVCAKCSGKGYVNSKEDITIAIPAGIQSGQTIELAGKGEAAEGGATGNLYATIRVLPDSTFQRKNNDLSRDADILFTQAALGDKIAVHTLDGEVLLKIPAGTHPEDSFRIKGKGMPIINSSKRGDLYVRVHIKTPQTISRDAKRLLEELRKQGL